MEPLKRKIEINGGEFMVYGKAPWITMPVKASDRTPECVIIIEASLLAYIYKSPHVSPHRFNAVAKVKEGGALIPVAFVGQDGRAKAREICAKLNDKLGRA